MDTPSSKNGSYLVFAVAIVAVIALILGIYSVSKVSQLSKQLGSSDMAGLAVRLDTVETSSKKAVTDAERATTRVTGLSTDTQRAFDQVGSELASIRTSINKLNSDVKAVAEGSASRAPTRAPAAASTTTSSPAPAATGAASADALGTDSTYVIQSGDTLSRIGAQFGLSWKQILDANPGIDPNRLGVGQKIYIPVQQ